MNWHNGDVSQAVNKVDKPNKYLIVYLRDEESLSIHYSDIFEKYEILQTTLQNCVCLNLLKGDKEFQQFSDVYKTTEVPSIYVIDYLGKVIDIIKGDIDEDKLDSRLKEIVLVDSKDDSKCSSNSVVSGEVERPDIDEKMAEIRQKLAEKQRQKQEEEKAKAIEDELNRRELGKKLVELKKFQKDQEEKDIKDEIKRQKENDKEARLKVLRQIEEDKQERKNRFAKQETSSSAVVVESQIGDTVVRNIASGSNNTMTRIQFRFPDGSAKNSTFECSAQFSVVRQFVANHVRETMNGQKFEIKQFFPKKTITCVDDCLTLSELQLVPSASLAVLFLDKSSSMMQATNYTDLLMAPINFAFVTVVSLVQWIKQLMFGTPTRPSTGTVGATGGGVSGGAVGGSDGVRDNAGGWQERQRRLIAAESRTIKKEGNLAQFSDSAKKKDDQDDATWNGNSTQQM